MRKASFGIFGLATALSLAYIAPSRADDTSILTASGEQLYQDGKKLYVDGKYAEACAKFATSQKADPASGTLFYLGLCSEKQGKTATAYGYFLDAAALARKEGGPASVKKAEAAQAKVDELAPKLARITIVVPDGAKVEGLSVSRDGLTLDPALWGVALPADAGEHVIAASAPGYVKWSSTATVKLDGDSVSVSVVPLVKEPPKPPVVDEKPPVTDPMTPRAGDDAGRYRTRRAVGWTIGSIGLAGIAVGTGFGLWARSRWNTAKPDCPGDVCRTQSAQSASEDARRYANISTITFVIGAVSLASGLVLVLTSSDPGPAESKGARVELAPAVGPGSLGFVVGGRF